MFIYNILIVIFVFLISYQIYLEILQPKLIEGMDSDTTTDTSTTPTTTTTSTTPTPTPSSSSSSNSNSSSSSSSTLAYQDYSSSDSATNSMILAQQNAGNIEYIKSRLLELDKVKQDVTDISGNVVQLTDNVEQLVQQQADYSQQQLPSSPPDISGASYDETESEEE